LILKGGGKECGRPWMDGQGLIHLTLAGVTGTEGLLQDGFFIDISSVLFLDFSPSPLGVSLFRVSPCDMGFS
jgi:hypothetical protein